MLFFVYYIFGLHFPQAIIRVTDFFIHTIEFQMSKLPYKGDHGINLIKSIKISTKKSLPEKHDVKTLELF